MTLGIFGAALFFGDGIITPAISVLGSLQGLEVAEPGLSHLVVPLSVGILIGLFVLQRYGSGTIGWLFGPVIVVWFVAIGLLGLREILKDPAVLQGLSPTWGVRFLIDHGVSGYLVLGGVVLAVTGAEALYADRGHFGAMPIRLGWFGLAFPALMLNYLGQAAMILHRPSTAENPFFLMAPAGARYPMLFLATAATIIASQAAISGSFSVARQAVQLGFLPRLKILHTSKTEGQIYVPIVNWGLCIGVVVLTLVFRSADKLGDIYGVAVTGTFILNTLLFVAVARLLWGTTKRRLVPVAALFLTVEMTFFSANIAKIEHGAWLPLVIALVLSLVMINWRRGQVVVTRNRIAKEGSLDEFLDGLPDQDPPLVRVPGVAVFLNPSQDTTPLALHAQVEHTHTLHERVLHRLHRHGQHPARRRPRPVRRREARATRLQRPPRHDPHRLPGQARRPRLAAPVPQAGPARAQPRPRARLLLRLAHHDHPDLCAPAFGPRARGSSSRWPATPRARSTTSDCPATAPS